jgi:hypothetical protein
MSPRVAERPAGLLMTGFENSSTPWSWSVSVDEPPRTWRPSGPTRSRPWRTPCGRCKPATPPRCPIRTARLVRQRHRPLQRTWPAQLCGQACCRWCRSGGRASANSARRRRRRSSGERSPGNGHQNDAGCSSVLSCRSMVMHGRRAGSPWCRGREPLRPEFAAPVGRPEPPTGSSRGFHGCDRAAQGATMMPVAPWENGS